MKSYQLLNAHVSFFLLATSIAMVGCNNQEFFQKVESALTTASPSATPTSTGTTTGGGATTGGATTGGATTGGATTGGATTGGATTGGATTGGATTGGATTGGATTGGATTGGATTGGATTGGATTGGATTGGATTGGATTGGATPTPTSTPAPTPTPPPVCDPLGGSGGGTNQNGIKGQMWYFNAADLVSWQPQNVSDFYSKGHIANADFFFSNFYVPTQMFSQGFDIGNGKKLQTNDGTELFEYFGFKFDGYLKLPDGSANKQYQFALLTDDGSNLLIGDSTGKLVINVADDGQHPTQLGCGMLPVTLSGSSYLPIEVQYFQGPRYHIALTLLYREWNPANTGDTYCGQNGNSLYWDPTTVPSTPQPAWNSLMTRWQIVPSSMFFLTNNQTTTNPCK